MKVSALESEVVMLHKCIEAAEHKVDEVANQGSRLLKHEHKMKKSFHEGSSPILNMYDHWEPRGECMSQAEMFSTLLQ